METSTGSCFPFFFKFKTQKGRRTSLQTLELEYNSLNCNSRNIETTYYSKYRMVTELISCLIRRKEQGDRFTFFGKCMSESHPAVVNYLTTSTKQPNTQSIQVNAIANCFVLFFKRAIAHSKRLAPYETLKKHRTTTEQAPYTTVK